MPIIREVPMVKPLLRWQEFMGFRDEQAASALALSLGEYRRQLSTRPTAQTARLCVLVALYNPDLEAIASAAANLDRLPSPPNLVPAAAPGSEDPAGDLCSTWS
jgi:hypothetical protein